MGIFETHLMTLTDNQGTTIKANLRVQKDTVNIPIQMMVENTIPVDYFMLYSIGWTKPVPQRGQYFVDQKTGTKYAVYGRPAVYSSHIEVQVSLPLGATP